MSHTGEFHRAPSLERHTRRALEQLAPERIVIAGGTAVVSEQVRRQLAGYADRVERIAGADRYATAGLLAAHGPTGTVAVAPGRDMPRALTAAGYAAAGPYRSPLGNRGPQGLLLTEPDRLPAATADALDRLAPSRLVRYYGVPPELDGALRRHVASVRFRATAESKFVSPDLLLLTTADSVVDAVAGAALTAASGDPVFVPQRRWELGGMADAASLISQREPSEVWLLGRAGDLNTPEDLHPLLCR